MISRSMLAAVLVFVFVLGSLALAQQAKTEQEKNLAAMKRFYNEVVNKGDLDLFDELTTEDFKENEALPGFESNREGVKQFFAMFRNAFPDLNFAVEDMAASGDKVWSYITIRGTHKGEFMGIPASGKKIEVKAIDIVRFVDGKGAEHWGVTDMLTMMQQIGAVPEPGAEDTRK